MEINFWNKQIETLPRTDLAQLQSKRLREVLGSAFSTQFYKRRLPKAGINSPDDIKTLDDLKCIPFTVKDDLRQSFPKGLLSTDMADVIRVHLSSGTTGVPTVIYFTKQDVANWSDLVARCIIATGASSGDIFQNMMTYGLFTGGLGLHYGAELVGMTVIPVSAGTTRRQVHIMRDFQTTVVHATPSYLLHIHSVLDQNEITDGDLCLKKAFIGAEPHSENIRLKIEDLWKIDAYNSYGLSEMNGPGVAFECVYKQGMHVWEDAYIIEIINPDTLEPVPDGEYGEVVFTNLVRHATPLLRYRTRDLARIIPGPCKCGRTHRRLSRITGRTDDMLIINGVNVFPSQIEEVIMRTPEVGTNYLIKLEKYGELDRLIVMVEIYSKMFSGDVRQLDTLKGKLKDELRASIVISPIVELHEPGSLPVSEGKAKRVLDTRPKD
jgi:phenylacetate-CoA ligase